MPDKSQKLNEEYELLPDNQAPFPSVYLLLSWERAPSSDQGKYMILHSVYGTKEDAEFVIERHKEHGQTEWGFRINEFREFVIQEVSLYESFGYKLPAFIEHEESWKGVYDELDEITKELEQKKQEENLSESEN